MTNAVGISRQAGNDDQRETKTQLRRLAPRLERLQDQAEVEQHGCKNGCRDPASMSTGRVFPPRCDP